MYSKQVTEDIIKYQALGFSAEETREALKKERGVYPNLNTIYQHRRSPIGQELASELLRQQERDILKSDSDNRELAMRYRNELLKIMIPQMSIALTKNINENKTEINVTSDLLKQYENLFEEAALLEHCAPQQIHTTQTNK
jgi:hypothetical protein